MGFLTTEPLFCFVLFFLFFFGGGLLVCFVFFRAAPAAYGSSQGRGQIRAVAALIAMPDLSCIGDLRHSLWKCQIFNPLSKARD